MVKQRLDQELVLRSIVTSRSQADSLIKLGKITVNGRVITKSGFIVNDTSVIKLSLSEQYVSRAGLKLAGVAEIFQLDFTGKVVLDVGSSTGGFTDYALKRGAVKVLAVDIGTNQLHPSLRGNKKIELHEKTDIRHFRPHVTPDIVLIDVSFISLRLILPSVLSMVSSKTKILAMCKPQFEGSQSSSHKGVVKNDAMRRKILQQFELWAKGQGIVINAKRDSDVAGSKGNRERFYLLAV